jgi:hypothetical protein
MKNAKCLVVPKEVKIRITRKDIDTGVFGHTRSCAIALAVKARLGDHPDVEGNEIVIDLPCGVHAIFSIPKKAVDFIQKFDAIEDDVPFWFGHYDFNRLPEKEQKALYLKARKQLKPFTFVTKLIEATYEK